MAKVHRKTGRKAALKGRPELLPTEEQTGIITDALVSFATAKEAYTLARVPASTYYLWLEKGKAAREAGRKDAFLDFLEKVEQSDAASTTAMLRNITKAAKEPKHWQAALALLRIKDPRRFGERVRVHVEAEFDDFLDRLQAALEPELFEKVFRAAFPEGEV